MRSRIPRWQLSCCDSMCFTRREQHFLKSSKIHELWEGRREKMRARVYQLASGLGKISLVVGGERGKKGEKHVNVNNWITSSNKFHLTKSGRNAIKYETRMLPVKLFALALRALKAFNELRFSKSNDSVMCKSKFAGAGEIHRQSWHVVSHTPSTKTVIKWQMSSDGGKFTAQTFEQF